MIDEIINLVDKFGEEQLITMIRSICEYPAVGEPAVGGPAFEAWWASPEGIGCRNLHQCGAGHKLARDAWEAGQNWLVTQCEDDICGFRKLPGATKTPHQVQWPGESAPCSKYVHEDCEWAFLVGA